MSAAKDSAIGTRVSAARQRLGWSREELAYRSKISWSAVAQIEAGRRTNLRPGTLTALAETLGLTIDYLVRGRPVEAPLLEHRALVYGSDDEFVDAVAPFLAQGLERSEPALVVTTPANADLLREVLGDEAKKVEFDESTSWYETPASALARYSQFARGKLDSGAAWIRVVGEPIWRGRSGSAVRLWTRYEALLNLVFASWPMALVCPYDQRAVRADVIRQAHLTHPQTIAGTKSKASVDFEDPAGFVLGSGGQ